MTSNAMIEQTIPGSLHKADMPDGCARAVEIGHRDVIQPSKTGGKQHQLGFSLTT
jgi:hypothetical protein